MSKPSVRYNHPNRIFILLQRNGRGKKRKISYHDPEWIQNFPRMSCLELNSYRHRDGAGATGAALEARSPRRVKAADKRKKINIQIGYGGRNAPPIKSLLVGM
jgi:hypothetical protein